ncbi:MAG: addiction module protein [Puniceicoccales bacterium]
MSITDQALALSKPEKLKLMEALWSDLSQEGDGFESPTWHEDALQETEQMVSEGKAHFVDWSEAKERLRNS